MPQTLERAKLVTGTGAPPILGLSPWAAPVDIFLTKKFPETIQKPVGKRADLLRWGKRLEQAIADEYSEQTGQTVIKPSPALIGHAKLSWLGGSPDFLVVRRKLGLECKKVSLFGKTEEWGASGTDQIPAHYLIQVMHYIKLCEFDEWHVAVLIGDCDFRMYVIYRDEELIKMLLDAEYDFYQRYIIGDEEPKLTGSHQQIENYIKRKWTRASKRKIAVSIYDHETKVVLENLRKARHQYSIWNRAKKEASAAIKLVMQDAVELHYMEDEQRPEDAMLIRWANDKDKSVVDWEAIAKAALEKSTLEAQQRAELVRKNTSTKPGVRRLIVHDANEDEE